MTPDWTQVGMFWSTALLVIITIVTTITNYKIYRNQTDPEIVVYSEHDVARPSIINLVIENIGKGVAEEITFSSDRPIPSRAFGLNDKCDMPKNMANGPLIVGIPELGPQSKRIITWGQYYGLKKALGSGTLTITTSYTAKKVSLIKSSKFTSSYTLDIVSYEGTDASDKNWLKKIAESTEDISDHLKEIKEKISQPTNRLS